MNSKEVDTKAAREEQVILEEERTSEELTNVQMPDTSASAIAC